MDLGASSAPFEKWARFYGPPPEPPPPWCSGRPSTHLARFLETGSVAVDGSAPSRVAAAARRLPPPPSLARTTLGVGCDDGVACLDVGCGSNGTNVALLASHGYYRAAGVDLVPEAVARARRGAAAWLADRSDVPPKTTMAFAAVDVMTIADESLLTWEGVRRMEAGESPPPSSSPPRRYALLFDCQTWHVLRVPPSPGEAAVVARYRSLLEPGGVLVLLCGRPAEGDGRPARSLRSDGPNEVSLQELRAAFCSENGFLEREIVASRFDPSPAYDRLPDGPPLAWAAVFQAV